MRDDQSLKHIPSTIKRECKTQITSQVKKALALVGTSIGYDSKPGTTCNPCETHKYASNNKN